MEAVDLNPVVAAPRPTPPAPSSPLKPSRRSLAETGQALARAAITGALANVEINLTSLKDQSFAATVRKRTDVIAN